MEPVKEERVSPMLQEPAYINPDPVSGIAQDEYKSQAEAKLYRNQPERTPSPPSSTSSGVVIQHSSQLRSSTASSNKHSILPTTTDLVCSNYKNLIESTTSSLLSSTAEAESPPATVPPHRTKTGIRDGCTERAIRTLADVKDHTKEHLQLFPAEDISDAVTRILEDYDWSQIPLANSDRRKVHVKRPMNAFMVWAQEARKKLSGQHRQVHNAELSKSLGRIWRGMSEDQKKPFIERAEQLRKKHKQEYPDYKYQPRRRKENIKTVSGNSGGKSPSNPSSCVSVQDLTAAHAFASMKGLGMHPLSPPHSPAANHATSRCHEGHGAMQEAVFVGECISADSFDGIDRAEMNKYLLPDQGVAAYVHGSHPSSLANPIPCSTAGSHMAPAIGSVSPVLNGSATTNTPVPAAANGSSVVAAGSTVSPGNCSNSLPPLQSLTHPRLLPSNSAYVAGSASPYYSGMSSPQDATVTGSPDIGLTEGVGQAASPGGSGGSPDSPVEYVELQPPRLPKEEPLSSLGNLKSPVNHFLPHNLCYSQHYPYNYPYAYPAWHG